MEKLRGFEIVEKYRDAKIALPKRATRGSAGYDIAAAEDTVVPSLWKAREGKDSEDDTILKSTLVPTGLKVFMPENEYLMLVNRSSSPMKHNLSLPNGIGIIDADYYNNENNEGEIFVQLINYGLADYEIKKGDRIAQGIFSVYQTINDEHDEFDERLGGFGSSGSN